MNSNRTVSFSYAISGMSFISDTSLNEKVQESDTAKKLKYLKNTYSLPISINFFIE